MTPVSSKLGRLSTKAKANPTASATATVATRPRLRRESGTLPGQIEERQRDDARLDAAAAALHGPLDAQPRPGRLVGRRHGSETDRLLQDRAPAMARDLADL